MKTGTAPLLWSDALASGEVRKVSSHTLRLPWDEWPDFYEPILRHRAGRFASTNWSNGFVCGVIDQSPRGFRVRFMYAGSIVAVVEDVPLAGIWYVVSSLASEYGTRFSDIIALPPEGRPNLGCECVYFIQRGNGSIKIGRSSDPVARLARFQTASPEPMVLLATTQGWVERDLHERSPTPTFAASGSSQCRIC